MVSRYESELREAERRIALAFITEAGWNVTKAAKLAGRTRANFYKRLKTLGIERPVKHFTQHRGNAEWQALQ